MKFSYLVLIVLILSLVTTAAAFGSPGAYERVLYYYAHLIDAGLSGKATTIVSKLGENDGFNEFIKYISKNNNMAVPSITKQLLPDVDFVANILIDMGFTDAYITGRIVKDVNEIADLFREVGRFFEGKLDAIERLPNGRRMLRAVRIAVQRIQFLRDWNIGKAAQEKLLRDHPDSNIRSTTKTLYSGGPTYNFLDREATVHANPTIDVKSVYRSKEHKKHDDICNAATEMRGRINGRWFEKKKNPS